MKRRILAALPFALTGLPAVQAATPVCGSPPVLARLAERLSQAGRHLTLDAASVSEWSQGTGRLIHCAVRGHLPEFQTTQYGTQMLNADFVVRYALELRPNGIFLSVE